MKTLLILTTGQTDVQLIVGDKRQEFKKNQCGRLHVELEERKDWCILTAPDIKMEGEVIDLPSEAFSICTPKLDAVLQYLNTNGFAVTNVLILETRRNPSVEHGDPRAAGIVLERRLRECLDPDLDIHRVAYLQENERYDDQKNIIRRDVVKRLDQAIREATQKISNGQVVVATTGGIPVIALLVDEMVQLYAELGASVELVEVADSAKRIPPTKDIAILRHSVPEPTESYRARRNALDLINHGNFLGAWGAVKHLDSDEVEREWTRVVEWLSLFAASMPLPPECDILVLKHRLMSVSAALRVELALRAGDVARAVHGTVAFFESALWDHLFNHYERHKTKHRWFRLNPTPPEGLVRIKGITEAKNHGRPFEVTGTENGITWYRIIEEDVCAKHIVEHYLQKKALYRLSEVVRRVRYLRNDVAHNEPTPSLMAGARRQMVKEGLWSSDGRFLTQGLIRDVLAELGEPHPENLCNNLIMTVRERLLYPQLLPAKLRGTG